MDGVVSFFRSIWGVWLMLLFAGIIVWAFWPRNRKKFSDAARIPLEDDERLPRAGDEKQPPSRDDGRNGKG